MKHKFIYFDFANTLAEIHPPLEVTIQKFLKKNKIFRNKKKIKQSILKTNETFFFSSLMREKNYKRDFYIKTNNLILKNLGIHNKFKNEMYNYILKSNKFWILKKNILPTLKQLKKEFNLGIISNFSKNLITVLKKLRIYKLFNPIIVSEIEGIEKQDKNFYKKIIKKYNINLKKTIFVGDNYKLDYLGPRKSGFKSFLITEKNDFILNKKIRKNTKKLFNKKNITDFYQGIQ
jgi:HAD superfamily hydrolase (TIGR01549 family)